MQCQLLERQPLRALPQRETCKMPNASRLLHWLHDSMFTHSHPSVDQWPTNAPSILGIHEGFGANCIPSKAQRSPHTKTPGDFLKNKNKSLLFFVYHLWEQIFLCLAFWSAVLLVSFTVNQVYNVPFSWTFTEILLGIIRDHNTSRLQSVLRQGQWGRDAAIHG